MARIPLHDIIEEELGIENVTDADAIRKLAEDPELMKKVAGKVKEAMKKAKQDEQG